MSRWSISNLFRAVTHKQFVDYTTQFQQAAEKSFNTECFLEIRALTRPKVYTTFWDEDMQRNLNATNDRNTILKTQNLTDITHEIWNKAGYIEVTVRPNDEEKAPRYAFGHAEFKGNRPRQATFYIQPDGEDAEQSVLSQTSAKRIGDGFESMAHGATAFHIIL